MIKIKYIQGAGFIWWCAALVLILSSAKVMHFINCDWIWVFSPFWIPLVILTLINLIPFAVAVYYDMKERKRKNVLFCILYRIKKCSKGSKIR